MILSKISNFLSQNKKVFIYFFFFIAFFYIFSDSVFAVTPTETTSTVSDTAKKVSTFFSEILKWISLMLGLMTYLVTMFLSPEWINGSLFWMTEKFKQVWILVSNVVYFVFAFILIWIAFMNIIWKTGEQYQLKQALPKFVVWVLIVPVSWFIVQFVLSISAIFTISAITLPFDTFNKDYKSTIWAIEIPKNCKIDLTQLGKKNDIKTDTSKGSSETKSNTFLDCWLDENWKLKPGETTELWKLIGWSNSSSTTIYWIISVYTFWIVSLDQVSKISLEVKYIDTIADLVVKIIFDVLFVLVYSILMITIWLVLMMRWIYLWLYIMFSPVFWLMYFFGKNEWGWEWFFWKFNIKEFVSLALVPVYTMLALSFWLVFMYTVRQGLTKTWDTWSSEIKINNDKNGINIWWDDWFNLEIVWAVATEGSVTKTMEQIWWWALWIVWTLIMKLLWIVVLWWAVMAALKTSEITKAIAAPIASFWENIWKIAQQLPQNAPIFRGQSMKSLENAGWNILSSIQSKQATKWSELSSKFIWWSENDTKYRAIKNREIWDINKAFDNLNQLKIIWNTNDISKSKERIDAYTKNFEFLLIWKQIYDNPETKKAMEMLKKWLWNPNEIKKAFELLDKNYINKNKSFIWWTTDVRSQNVDDYLGSKASSNDWDKKSWTNSVTLNVINNSVWERLSTSLLAKEGDENRLIKWVITEISREITKNTVSKEDIKNLLNKHWITDDTSIKEVIKWLEKEKFFKEPKKGEDKKGEDKKEE